MKLSPKDFSVPAMIGSGIVLTTLVIGGLVIYTDNQKDDDTNTQTDVFKSFKDGKYYAEGQFFVEAINATETVGVTLTIEKGKITKVETDLIEDGQVAASEYMVKFEEKINEMVVGKNLSEIGDSTIVSGSTLTSEGFQDAAESIKREANI